MWREGSLKIGNQIFTYCAKVYGEPSEDYGLEGGYPDYRVIMNSPDIERISPLKLRKSG